MKKFFQKFFNKSLYNKNVNTLPQKFKMFYLIFSRINSKKKFLEKIF